MLLVVGKRMLYGKVRLARRSGSQTSTDALDMVQTLSWSLKITAVSTIPEHKASHVIMSARQMWQFRQFSTENRDICIISPKSHEFQNAQRLT